MIIDSMLLLIVMLLVPAICLLIAAVNVYHAGKFAKKSRVISYIIALLSFVLFTEFIRHFTSISTSFLIHAVVSNMLTIITFCLLSHVCYLLIFKHSRFSILGAPSIFYLPLALYGAFYFAATQANLFSTQLIAAKDIQVIATILSISAGISILMTLNILVKGIKYAPSKKRKQLYRNLLITLLLAIVMLIVLTYAIPYTPFIYEPALSAALLYGIVLVFSIRNITFSPSLKSNYKMIVDVSPIAIAVLDGDFNILEVNKKAKEMFQFAVNTPLQTYFNGAENEEAIINCLQVLQHKKAIYDYQLTYFAENQEEPRHLSIDAVLIYVEHSHNYCFMIRDVTNEREQELLNYHLAYHDPLTDLHNRAYFVRNVEKSLQQTDSSHRSALVLIDINFFKQINDTYGHQIGDLVLIHIAKVLREHAKSASFIARLGGDEFVLYYNMLQSIQAFDEEIALIRQAFRQQLFEFNELSFEVVPSFGHATYPTDSTNFEGLYHIADERMYEDKRIIKENYQMPEM